MSRTERRIKRKLAIAAAMDSDGMKKAEDLITAYKADKLRQTIIEEIKPIIESNIETAFAVMVLWTLHDKHGMKQDELQRLVNELYELHDDLNNKSLHINLAQMMDVLRDECEITFVPFKPIPGCVSDVGAESDN